MALSPLQRFARHAGIITSCVARSFGLYAVPQLLCCAIKAILATVLSVSVVLLCWAIVFVELFGPLMPDIAKDGGFDQECVGCGDAFSSVMQACLSMLQHFLAIPSWGRMADPLVEKHPWAAVVLVCAIASVHAAWMTVAASTVVKALRESQAEAAKEVAREDAVRALLNAVQALQGAGSTDWDQIVSCSSLPAGNAAIPSEWDLAAAPAAVGNACHKLRDLPTCNILPKVVSDCHLLNGTCGSEDMSSGQPWPNLESGRTMISGDHTSSTVDTLHTRQEDPLLEMPEVPSEKVGWSPVGILPSRQDIICSGLTARPLPLSTAEDGLVTNSGKQATARLSVRELGGEEGAAHAIWCVFAEELSTLRASIDKDLAAMQRLVELKGAEVEKEVEKEALVLCTDLVVPLTLDGKPCASSTEQPLSLPGEGLGEDESPSEQGAGDAGCSAMQSSAAVGKPKRPVVPPIQGFSKLVQERERAGAVIRSNSDGKAARSLRLHPAEQPNGWPLTTCCMPVSS